MCDPLVRARSEFLRTLNQGIDSHGWKRTFDAGMHQSLVIGAAIAGFAALALGLMAKDHPEYSLWAGVIGALTSVATILSQQLHCVRAINWHDRMKVELEDIKGKFVVQYKSEPDEQALTAMNNELAQLKSKMNSAWEKIMTSGPSTLGHI